MTVKERLIKYIDYKKINKRRFCLSIGVSEAFISSMRISIQPDKVESIASKYPDLNTGWLLTGDGEMLKTGTPQLSKVNHGHGIPLIPIDAVAGLPSIMTDSITQTDCDHYCVPDFTDKGVEYLIRVSGSSMYPKYANGDILGCVRVKDILFFQWGKVYVLDTSQGALVKRVFECKDDSTLITLVSDNKEHYPPFNIPRSDIRSLSLVAGVIRME